MIRLILLVLLLLVSLLILFNAPTYHLWLLAIAAGEFPLVPAGITILITATGFFPQRYQVAGTVVGFIALLIFFSPIARAYYISRQITADMALAADQKVVENKADIPFQFSKLFKFTSPVINATSITYISYPDTALTLDYYPSQQLGKRPCIVVVHGGSWSGGDSKQLPELNSYLAKAGYNVASINYRLAPKYQSPAPIEDVRNAMNYLRNNATKLHIDTNNFVLLGRSAGAQIALLVAYTLHQPGLKGVIDFYGPADMVWGYSLPANPFVMDSRGVMERYLGGPYKQVPKNYAASSPVEFVNRQSVPTLIIHGANDVLVAYEHSRRLNEKLQQNGIKHYWLKLPWATHGFDYNINGPGGQLSTYAVETFLKSITH